MPCSKTRLRASRWTSRGQSVLGAASSDLIRFGESLGEFRETWESARLEPHEFIEAGDLVVVPGTQHLKGRGGIEVVASATFVWTIRNGAIERVTMYQERQDALEAVGLSEQDAHADS